jgi:hypothetical protein
VTVKQVEKIIFRVLGKSSPDLWPLRGGASRVEARAD